jgi:hypothetical protein
MAGLKSICATAAIIAITVIMASLLALSADAAEQRTKETALRDLMVLIKADALVTQLYQQTIPTVVPTLREAFPDLPERGYQIFEEELFKAFEGGKAELISQITQMYAKRFTLEEIEYLAQFYRTPIGQKYLSELPSITQEAVTFGQQWGARLGQQAGQEWGKRVTEEGLLK